jgi:hypothetical protein
MTDLTDKELADPEYMRAYVQELQATVAQLAHRAAPSPAGDDGLVSTPDSIGLDTRFHLLLGEVCQAEEAFSLTSGPGSAAFDAFEKAAAARTALIAHINDWASRRATTKPPSETA